MPRILRFTSMAQFVDTLKRGPDVPTSTGIGVTGVLGVATFPEAYKLALDGWPSEATNISALSTPIVRRITSLVERASIVYDVEGMQVDISRYLDNEPECWQAWTSEIVEGQGSKHLRIVFNSMVSGGLGTNIIRAKGAGIAALIEALEFAGVRVQLDVAICYAEFDAYVMVKSSDQPLDMPKLAFALCHPAMPRKLFFRLMDIQDDWKKFDARGHGYSGEYVWTSKPQDGGDMYFGHSSILDPEWSNVANVQKWILGKLASQGVHLIGQGNEEK